jgi:predicted transcriptional regulator
MSGLRAAVSSQRRADLDELAYRLRAEGMTLQAIADRLGVTLAMARRRVIRHERLMRERQKAD